jgi:hypothetical protein
LLLEKGRTYPVGDKAKGKGWVDERMRGNKGTFSPPPTLLISDDSKMKKK